MKNWFLHLSTAWKVLAVSVFVVAIGGGGAFALKSSTQSDMNPETVTNEPKVEAATTSKASPEEVSSDTPDTKREPVSPTPTPTPTVSTAPTPPAVAISTPQRMITGFTVDCRKTGITISNTGEGVHDVYSPFKVAHWSDGATDELGSDAAFGKCDEYGNLLP